MAENIKPTSKDTIKISIAPSNVHAQRMSFASVAAMAPPGLQRSKADTGITPSKSDYGVPSSEFPTNCQSRRPPTGLGLEEQSKEASHLLNAPLAHLAIKDNQALMANDHDHDISTTSLPVRPKLDDEKTHLSFSSTKAPSLDGKSVTSGTTFAMDEKESIRPDDSASVKAAEDDDSNSGPVSGDLNSRVGSEAGSKAFRDQFNEISEKIAPNVSRPVPQPRRVIPGMAEGLRKGPSPTTAAMGSPVSISRPDIGITGNAAMEWEYQDPDEKLLEAMENPKDRFFLLQLEQQVISFIRDSHESVLDLPPCNSFCRLLAHRLGDYYALSHYVDNSVSAVRLYRTPFCQLRNPLSDFANKSSTTEEGPAVAPSMKIMRRAGIGTDGQIGESGATTTDNSVGPSKASSETGDDSQRPSGIVSPTESSSAKDKVAVTREEREAKYKEARDRIFADWKEGEKNETVQTDEITNDASRASSTSGKKKKKNSKNDDGFDSRSAYNAYYPPRPGSFYEQSTNHGNLYSAFMQQGNGQPLQATYPPPFGQPYPRMPQIQSYHMPPQMSISPQNQMIASPDAYHQPNIQTPYLPYGQSIPSQYYSQPQQLNQTIPLPATMPPPALSNITTPLARPQTQMPDPSWTAGAYQSPYQVFSGNQSPYQAHVQPTLEPSHLASSVPYAYGQLPYQANGQGARSVHPVPGSYNRQNFNPQSRAFIPGTTFFPPATAANDLSERPGEMNANSTHNGFFDPIPTSSYSMPQIASLPTPGQLPSPFQSQHSSPRTLPPAAHLPSPFQSQHSSPRRPASQVPRSHSPGLSTLSKWGTPSTLPPKPPPPASANPASNGNALGGVPTFHNGAYLKPNGGPTETNLSSEPIAIE